MQSQNIEAVDFEKDRKYLIKTYIKDYFDYLFPKIIKIGKLFNRVRLRFNFIGGNIKIIDIHSDEYLEFLPSIEKRFETFDKFQKDVNLEIMMDHYIGNRDLSLNIPINFSFQKKSMRIQYLNNGLSSTMLYSNDSKKDFEQITKEIITYIMNEIKNHSKN
jgi:hypothetical protein